MKIYQKINKLNMMAHLFNPITLEEYAGEALVSPRPAPSNMTFRLARATWREPVSTKGR